MTADPLDFPAPPPEFARYGMGWRYCPPNAPVVFTFDRIVERRDEVSAEIKVTTRDGGFIARRRLNLLGSRSHSEWAKDLEDGDGGAQWPWKRLLTAGCEATLEAYRAGSPVEIIQGRMETPPPVDWLCEGLVMAGVVNCWVAAASTGKSTFAKALCYAVATGSHFLGRPCRQGNTLYIDYEDTVGSYKETIFRLSGGDPVPAMYWLRGSGPITQMIARIAELVDKYDISLVVWDAVAAMATLGDRTYEAVASDIEASISLLRQTVTQLLLDHITGDELKTGAMPLKARGSSRKYEFVRYQWTLGLDREQAALGKHVVGWTHTKSNRTRLFPSFGVEIIHHDDTIGFAKVQASDVTPVRERMSKLEKCLDVLRQNPNGMTLNELVSEIEETISRNVVEGYRVTLKRAADRHQVRLTNDGLWTVNLQTSAPPLRFPGAD